MRSDWDDADIQAARDRVLYRHEPVVPTAAGLAPWCTCGWPETEGGRKMFWRPGDKMLHEHLAEFGEQ